MELETTEASCVIELSDKLPLTDRQQESLENAVYSVYGSCQIIYEKSGSSRFPKAVKKEENRMHEKSMAGPFKTVRSEGTANTARSQLLFQSQDLSKELDTELQGPTSGWYKISKALRQKLGDDVYRNWFTQVVAEERLDSKATSQGAKSLVLYLPSKMMRDMVRQRYGNLIEQYCKNLTLLKFYSYENIVTADGDLQISGST